MTDDMPEEDLPYLEMLYKFTYGKKSYYDLLITRHVEAQAGERAELGGATTTPDERYSAGASSVKQGAEWSVATTGRTAPVLYRSFNVKSPLENPTFYPCSCSAKNPKMGRDYV